MNVREKGETKAKMLGKDSRLVMKRYATPIPGQMRKDIEGFHASAALDVTDAEEGLDSSRETVAAGTRSPTTVAEASDAEIMELGERLRTSSITPPNMKPKRKVVALVPMPCIGCDGTCIVDVIDFASPTLEVIKGVDKAKCPDCIGRPGTPAKLDDDAISAWEQFSKTPQNAVKTRYTCSCGGKMKPHPAVMMSTFMTPDHSTVCCCLLCGGILVVD